MSHRVVNLQAKVTDSSKAASLKNEVENKLDSKDYDLNERTSADGEDLEGNATLNVKTQHNLTSEGKEWSSWLMSWVDTNQASFNSDGSISTHGLSWVRVKCHDCWHSVEGVQEPCEPQGYKSYDIRPE